MGGVTVITKNGGVDVITSQKVISTLPVGWDEMIAAFGRGYNFPKPSGQTTVFRTGDDADIEAMVFAPIRVANSLKIQNSKINFLTLGNTNSFGNTDVFTDILGGQDFAGNGDLVIDNDSGLMWYRISSASQGSWNAQIDAALASTQGGHSDWFMPNLNQMISIINTSQNTSLPIDWGIFSTFTGAQTWYSTTNPANTSNALRLNTLYRVGEQISKTLSGHLVICRKQF